MSKGTLYDKVIDNHTVGVLPSGQLQVYVGRHLVHEVTSPPAFEDLRERGLTVARPELALAVVDHVVPTLDRKRPFNDGQAELMAKTLEDNVMQAEIECLAPGSGKQGVCHVAFSEQGFIWPGQIVVCGDSHTSTYGAFGALALGIGTTEVSHVLATQTLATSKQKVKRINFNGLLGRGVTAKDLALYMIKTLGVSGGLGFAYEFCGNVIDGMGMEGRMTLCNMAVEGGARSGYVNPDWRTFTYLEDKPLAPKRDFPKAVEYWKSVASDPDAVYDATASLDVKNLGPMVTWGTNPGQAIGIEASLPKLRYMKKSEREQAEKAYKHMGLEPGQRLLGLPVDVVFIGSCTNGRLSDLNAAAEILYDRHVKVPTIIVPGSEEVKYRAEASGLDKIFVDAGAEWREPGCSMCLAMNPDKLVGSQRSASTSNRNFIGRQGSPTGRTHLVSPYTAAATAIEGKIANPLKYLR